jgi:hypothetical protein
MGGGPSKVWETSMEGMNGYADSQKKDGVLRGRYEVSNFITEAAKQLALLSPWGDVVGAVFAMIDGSDAVDEAALKSLLQEVISEAFQDAALKESLSKFRTSLAFLNQAKTNTDEDTRKRYTFQAHETLLDAVNTLYQFANHPAPTWSKATAQLFFAYCTIAPVRILALSLVSGTTREGLKNATDTMLTDHGKLKSKYFDYRKSLLKREKGDFTGQYVYRAEIYHIGLYDEFTNKRWQGNQTTYDEYFNNSNHNPNVRPRDPQQDAKYNDVINRYMVVVGDDVEFII